MYTEATPELILEAYRQGIFPMAESAESKFFDFYRPEKRGQLSIENLHIPKRLKKTVRQMPYRVSVNKAFEEVIDLCAEKADDRTSTWINKPIRNVFIALHGKGFAHSVECWAETKEGEEELAGGLYGLAIGGVFCGESMVSRYTDASKIALVHLCARLWKARFEILDTQFTNAHLEQFGVYDVRQEDYELAIKTAMHKKCDFLLNNFSDLNEFDLIEEYISKGNLC